LAITLYPTLGAAYRLKELFNDLWKIPDHSAASAFLTDWCVQVEQAKIPAFQKFVAPLRAHWSGIILFVE
jgi:transposase